MKLFALFIPGRGMLILQVSHRTLHIILSIQLFDRFAEQFKISMEQYFGEHEFLVDR